MYRILDLNPQLEPFAGDIDLRMHLYRSAKKRILSEGQSLNDFANAHMYFGFHHVDGGWYYREWAPSAYQLYLEGEFNGWNQTSHPLTNLGNGNWELYLPGDDALWDGCKVKTVVDANLTRTEHIPLYARRVVQNKQNITFECEVVDDRKAFPWTDKGFTGEDELYIYEAHIGMAQEEGKVGSYREFADNILPRIHKAGYNTLQLMAIMEHPYYGSFGYQVSSFFAASSWFGKPEDLKYLVNKAHAMGIRVLLDVVHSHAVKNTAEGINMFDGTTWQFFHDGPKGDHPAWGTKCFDYGKTGVIHFLLSNLKFWMTDYTEGLASVQLTGLSTEGDNPDIIVPYDKGSNTYTAIVAPQSVAAGTVFITSTFTNGKAFVYKMKNATDWQAGGEYTYTVSLAAAKDLGYTIESNGSYTVYNADGLLNVAELVNGGKTDINITLTADIDLTGKDWTPIGTDYDNSYKGTFDGGGHTITGLTFTTNDEFAGLFGWLNRAGTVKNVVMEGVQITSNQIYGGSIGGVVGSGWGTIENCSVSGSVSGTVYVGGVVGVQIGGSITGCSSSATVKGTVDVGGVAGQTNSSATLTACYATGNVTIEIAPKKNIAGGGLVGMNAGSSLLACYATGNVTSTGSSTGYVHIGGFLGNNYANVMTACYWKNNHEQGIGYNKKSTEATKVDGTGVTWKNAVDAMNTALQNAGSKWRYELNGALPTLRKQ